jgi:GTPase SAR1 family protein
VNQANFGERYFASREQISQVVNGITELARDTDTPLEDLLSTTALEKDLGTPFLFVVCGEVNAGKSSLINGLFGCELCKVNILPETDRVIWYRHGAVPRDIDTTPSLKECFQPIDFLRDFNLIDTPGTNSAIEGHQEITERFLSIADLILFVFPVTNPWGVATWNLISALPQERHKRVAYIIQQSDQREAADLKIIAEHMSELSIKKIGIVPPIFAVSAKNALEAKRAGASRTLEESGFPALEDFISRHVCDSSERRAALISLRSHASTDLRKIEDRIEEKTRTLGEQNHFLSSLEDEIDAMRERLVARLPCHLAEVAEVFEREAVCVTRSLRKWLNPFLSVFRVFIGDRTGSRIESLFIDRLRIAVEAVAESDGADIVAACRSHWDALDARVKEAIGSGLDEQEPIDENLAQARRRFVQSIDRAAHLAINNLHVRKELEADLRRRNLALKSFTASTLIFLIVGATFGIFGFQSLPTIFCYIAALFAVGGALIALVTRRNIARDFQSSLLDTCGAFAETLRADYEDALHIFFQDYTSCLNSIRKHLAKQKIAIEPKLTRWQQLFLTLKSIEQDS